ADTPEAAAEAWLAATRKRQGIQVEDARPVQVAAGAAWRVRVRGTGSGGALRGQVTFVPHAGATYLITGLAPAFRSDAYDGRFLSTARSFGPLAPERAAALRVERLRIVSARPGETLAALVQRTGDAWDLQRTAVVNGVFADHRFAGGELVKVARRERAAG